MTGWTVLPATGESWDKGDLRKCGHQKNTCDADAMTFGAMALPWNCLPGGGRGLILVNLAIDKTWAPAVDGDPIRGAGETVWMYCKRPHTAPRPKKNTLPYGIGGTAANQSMLSSNGSRIGLPASLNSAGNRFAMTSSWSVKMLSTPIANNSFTRAGSFTV